MKGDLLVKLQELKIKLCYSRGVVLNTVTYNELVKDIDNIMNMVKEQKNV